MGLKFDKLKDYQNLPSNPPNASGAPEVKRSSINNSDYGYDPALGTVNATNRHRCWTDERSS